MADFTRMKLGRQPAKIDSRTLQLRKYLRGTLPPPPPSCNWSSGITQFGMCLNGPNDYGPPVPGDGLGDCTIAACTHACTIWRAAVGQGTVILPDWVTLKYYSMFDGYVYGDESTDNGGVVVTVLNDWRNRGYGYRPHKHEAGGKRKHGSDQLLAYAQVNVADKTEIQQSINLFAVNYIGLNLPLTAQNQNIWAVVGDGMSGPSAPGSWGGHSVVCIGYDLNYIWCVTWGQLMAMTYGFWRCYVDESFALLSSDFLTSTGVDPEGFSMSTLLADLQQVTA